eukprot:CAMPEP_0170542854 /NCGR_PEP_ID=MMETSP0211-20121228/2158_1 /TAXON_ID=311385 /ORGANISM="Pseudokeronopsis sp., Strain OXSARD2" /LENGTH=87 /DNA_ID=CAMNT_0010846057 /DNA_START=201 /DNA_END=461 /DNA_ORIENTATION=-
MANFLFRLAGEYEKKLSEAPLDALFKPIPLLSLDIIICLLLSSIVERAGEILSHIWREALGVAGYLKAFLADDIESMVYEILSKYLN